MDEESYNNLVKGDYVLYARVLPNVNYYQIENLRIVTVRDDYITGVELNTKKTYLFNKKDALEYVFINRAEAIEYLERKKDEHGFNDNTIY